MISRITIEDYDPLWPQRFETLRLRIAATLGDLAIAIEHIGSTAVPGLSAKPVIDIDVLLRSATDLSPVINRLSSLGYDHQGNLGIAGREAFRTPHYDFPHHLYVCPPGSEEYKRHLAFRNYLRTHPEDAHAYDALKRHLADKYRADRDSYTVAKSEFIAEILHRALQPHRP
jgi:GrpB-like predicted nucleotidyltransferase (UPF0157 family)